ncbi:uncharacterized protein wu:fc75a09 [Rhinichthys klamathensis goyatoka]|uniref:uncharacterized protein wu:fc75a09 n=1 Tax=Rhinichthys klamathensis goyatoka TaxID=3034132 RepID=UPI0024B6081C|nr:uncharacterized protein wu:fc75a09 [Rhinichthys klamathensis goyatoka]
MVYQKEMKTMPEKITTMRDLNECGFGQPGPRHGLKLLYWFAKDCIWVNDDGDMFLACNPAEGVFGFHLFENRYTKRKEKLLPDVNFHYYLLGNLNSPGANMLPEYIKKHNNSMHDVNNADRLIVTDHEQRKFGNIYLTTHNDQSNYDPNATFHISRSLLKIIKSYPNLEDFLQGLEDETSNQPASVAFVGLYQMVQVESEKRIDVTVDTDTPSRNCVCSCTIL